jgi:D-beta-D-heptose 7-phosphate kinase/D-beta-D-heptose 1-phosphate adenosyltransferase
MKFQSKIMAAKGLASRREDFRKAGKSVVCAAKSEGDLLVVGLNSDKSVRLIKGDRRPIVEQNQRAELLASLWCVDYVILFDEPDPLKIIQLLKPEVLVKGEDWSEKDIVGADFVKANGGRVVRVPLVGAASTSAIIQRVVERYC